MIENQNFDVFALPIIRADDKTYLEELQCGELFMRNAIYYQADEEKDPRNDAYDSAMPVGDLFGVKTVPKIGSVNNERFIDFGWYIKCFYQFKPSDIHRKHDGSYCLRMSSESKKWFSELKKEYVIMLHTREFIRRFYAYCDLSDLRHAAGAVHYLDDVQYKEYKRAYICAMLNAFADKDYNQKIILPTLCKRERFSAQQEVRVCVHYSDINDYLLRKHGSIANLSYQEVEMIRNKTITEKIGSFADISKIYTMEEILSLEIPVYPIQTTGQDAVCIDKNKHQHMT